MISNNYIMLTLDKHIKKWLFYIIHITLGLVTPSDVDNIKQFLFMADWYNSLFFGFFDMLE